MSKIIRIDLPWGTTSTDGSTPYPRLYTQDFTCSDELIITLHPPAGARSIAPGSIGLTEFAGSYEEITRLAVLSTIPSWYYGNNATYNYKIATTIKFALQVGGAQAPGVFLMEGGTPYYLNCKNANKYGQQSCPTGQSCNMSIEFIAAPGT